mmetsp:Transcript_66574/g.124229  ORF Transcript_66574/g.124229 Transcript_66574/m.124229 type:complete len:273 (-) Transcript_66574:26-844(-)
MYGNGPPQGSNYGPPQGSYQSNYGPPQGSYQSYQGNRGGGGGFDSGFEPQNDPQEFFLKVFMTEANRRDQAATAAKIEGRAKMGRMGSLIGGMLGSVAGGKISDEFIVDEITPLLVDKAHQALRRQGYKAQVFPILLPKQQGHAKQLTYLKEEGRGLQIILRVEVMEIVGRNNVEEVGLSLWNMCFGLCGPQPVGGQQRGPSTALPFNQPAQNANQVALKMEDDLRNPSEHYKVQAQVHALLAADLYHQFHNEGWSRENSRQAIVDARSRRY